MTAGEALDATVNELLRLFDLHTDRLRVITESEALIANGRGLVGREAATAAENSAPERLLERANAVRSNLSTLLATKVASNDPDITRIPELLEEFRRALDSRGFVNQMALSGVIGNLEAIVATREKDRRQAEEARQLTRARAAGYKV